MKKIIEIADVKLKDKSPLVIRRLFFGASLLLGATLLGATIASGFDPTHIKLSLAIMTIPAYVFFFLSGFCHKITIAPSKKSISFYPLLKKEPSCFTFEHVTAIRKRVLHEKRVLYRFKIGRSKFTLCADQQGIVEGLFQELVTST